MLFTFTLVESPAQVGTPRRLANLGMGISFFASRDYAFAHIPSVLQAAEPNPGLTAEKRKDNAEALRGTEERGEASAEIRVAPRNYGMTVRKDLRRAKWCCVFGACYLVLSCWC
jgi:hypothetical protein